MAENTHIQWATDTWNPIIGCKKVSPGCKFCYAERDMKRYGKNFRAPVRTKTTFEDPLKWEKKERRIFTASWSDWFIPEFDEHRADAWDIIRQTPYFNYLILTKRPERIMQCLPDDWGLGYSNVWLGVSGENQAMVDKRVPILIDIPAVVHFLSYEPALSRIKLEELNGGYQTSGDLKHPWDGYLYNRFHMGGARHMHYKLDWVIAGGESGVRGKYRPCRLDYLRKVVHQCKLAETPVFVKQLGTSLAKEMRLKDWKGGNMDEFPEDLQVRQFPNPFDISLN